MHLNRESLTILLCFYALLLISFVCFIGPWIPSETKSVNQYSKYKVDTQVAGVNTNSRSSEDQLQAKVYPFSNPAEDSYLIPEDFPGTVDIGRGGINIEVPKTAGYKPIFILTNNQSQIKTDSWLRIIGSQILQPQDRQGADLRVIFSFDNRSTWRTFRDGLWQEIDWGGAVINGISDDELAGITSQGWQAQGGFIPGVTETLDIGLVINPRAAANLHISEVCLTYERH